MIVWVFAFLLGGVGVLLRLTANHYFVGTHFPWATLLANGLGSFGIGLIFGAGYSQSTWGVALAVGLFGGLTTFSSYALDTVKLIQSQQVILAAINFLSNNIVAVVLCLSGVLIAKYIR